jgi:hypothetical protein
MLPRRLCACAIACLLAGCGTLDTGGWTPLVEGSRGLENFLRVGDANWTASDGAIQATSGRGDAFLVTRVPYRDFMLRAEFWASHDANSGIFFRCQSPMQVSDETCYEANIFDQLPEGAFGTGAIVRVARANPPRKAGGRWNTFEITAKGRRLTLVLNGVTTADVEDARFASGPIALQWARGVIKWRKVEVKPL